MTIKILILSVSFIISTSSIQAGSQTSGLAFLKMGVNGRALGMGDAYSSIADDPSAMFYNPAALSLSTNSKLIFSHRRWFQDTRMDFLGASSSYCDISFSAGINATSIPGIKLYSKPGPAEGTFSARFASIGLALSYPLTNSLMVGSSANLLYEKIFINEASGYGLNFGVLFKSPWNTNFAIAINNLGSMNKLQAISTKLPTMLRIGGSYLYPIKTWNSIVTLATDILHILPEASQHIHIGGEFQYENVITLRSGYQLGYEMKNLSAGLGVLYKFIRLDYSYVPFRYCFGSSHIFSVGFDLD